MSEYKNELGRAVAERLETQFRKTQQKPGLRLSKLGPMCPRALWYSVHKPEEAEPMPPWAEAKFSLGHIVEAYAITLAKAAGHRVEGEQDELELDGIIGHRDCIIDGCTVDVKSCSSKQFQKIRSGGLADDDTFGYLVQLDGYLGASSQDNLVTDKQHAYLMAVDKQLGHMYLYEHTFRLRSVRKRIEECKRVVAAVQPPECTCGYTELGADGNVALDTQASYSPYKWNCWPSLRCCLYSKGPVFFTHVRQWPKYKGVALPEVDKFGNLVYG